MTHLTNAIVPSPQQQAVIDWVVAGEGNVFVEAVAGAGKSTLLRQACRRMVGSIVICAFNKKIAREMDEKLNEDGERMTNVQVSTIHSLGFSAWRRFCRGGPKIVVDGKSKRSRMHTVIETPEELMGLVGKLVDLSRQSGVMLFWPVSDRAKWFEIIERHDLNEMVENDGELDAAIDYAIKGLAFHKQIGKEHIDFEDMIWLPVVHEIKPWRNDWILVDEAQDTNPSRRALIRKLLMPEGRVIFVGDRKQAIYGFTGADNDAIDQIINDFDCDSLPLTVTYRCPHQVVKLAREYVDHIEAHISAPEGGVFDYPAKHFMEQVVPTLKVGDAILCRNTKPIVSLAFTLIRKLIPCHVEGRDIGANLIELAKRFSKVRSIELWRTRLENYRDRSVEKLNAKGKETQAQSVEDKVETLLVLADGCSQVSEVIDRINQLFKDSDNPDGTPNLEARNRVVLSTVHKAKGREWNRVFILGFNKYMPSKYARQEWQKDQERNIIYVAITRSKNELALVEALE